MDEEILRSAETLFTTSFSGVIRVELIDDEQAFWVDGRPQPPRVTGDAPLDLTESFCLWRIGRSDFVRFADPNGTRIVQSYIIGRLRISGDMSVMARLEVAK